MRRGALTRFNSVPLCLLGLVWTLIRGLGGDPTSLPNGGVLQSTTLRELDIDQDSAVDFTYRVSAGRFFSNFQNSYICVPSSHVTILARATNSVGFFEQQVIGRGSPAWFVEDQANPNAVGFSEYFMRNLG